MKVGKIKKLSSNPSRVGKVMMSHRLESHEFQTIRKVRTFKIWFVGQDQKLVTLQRSEFLSYVFSTIVSEKFGTYQRLEGLEFLIMPKVRRFQTCDEIWKLQKLKIFQNLKSKIGKVWNLKFVGRTWEKNCYKTLFWFVFAIRSSRFALDFLYTCL